MRSKPSQRGDAVASSSEGGEEIAAASGADADGSFPALCKAPDCAPCTYLEDLIAEAEHTTQAWVASAHGGRDEPTLPCPDVSLDRLPEFIAEEDALELLTEELRLWRAYYRRCRDEFKHDQLTVFPAGTDRFCTLGAAVDPCPTYVAPPAPLRRFPPRPPPV